MNASVKSRYQVNKAHPATATLSFKACGVKLRASMTEATFVDGLSLNGVTLGLEKPGFFTVDYNVPKEDFCFQFMNTVQVEDKPLNLTYTHTKGDDRTVLDGVLVLDSANKASVNHVLGSSCCKLKYTYVHKGATTFEYGYDFAALSWNFALARRIGGDDVLSAAYQTSRKHLGLEWTRNSKVNGSLKISASINMAEEKPTPKVTAESTWDLEI